MENAKIEQWSPEQLHSSLDRVLVIDVRRPDEFRGELSHIQGARLVTLESALQSFLENSLAELRSRPLVFVCRSGMRSSRAAEMARSLGYEKIINMSGGMMAWNASHLPVAK